MAKMELERLKNLIDTAEKIMGAGMMKKHYRYYRFSEVFGYPGKLVE